MIITIGIFPHHILSTLSTHLLINPPHYQPIQSTQPISPLSHTTAAGAATGPYEHQLHPSNHNYSHNHNNNLYATSGNGFSHATTAASVGTTQHNATQHNTTQHILSYTPTRLLVHLTPPLVHSNLHSLHTLSTPILHSAYYTPPRSPNPPSRIFQFTLFTHFVNFNVRQLQYCILYTAYCIDREQRARTVLRKRTAEDRGKCLRHPF